MAAHERLVRGFVLGCSDWQAVLSRSATNKNRPITRTVNLNSFG
jgi:hypothetical protein